jgi:UDP-galactopyranose mutase
MPFAINESTKFISPTKNALNIWQRKPVISTPIRDVVRPYGELGISSYCSYAQKSFVSACEQALSEHSEDRVQAADEFLSQMSWDKTGRKWLI